ncbi:MAG: PAS domain S-box protein [Deltaproteobacteria bacterium]|nr:PAS domain S-box protein [Deltaproteobacteria bacterium]
MDQPLRILILEDNPADAELARFELQEAGLTFAAKVVAAEEDFVRELKEFSPDLIISDYDIPRYNGVLALDEAKRQRPDAPFILVTGAIGEDRAIEILTRGAKDYVMKDRLRQRLVPAVQRALAEAEERGGRNRAEAELREAHRTLEERVRIRTAELEAEMEARKWSEAALRLSEERFRELAELLPETIFETDIQGTLTFVNKNAFDCFQYAPEDFSCGFDFLETVALHDRGRALENAQRHLSREYGDTNEYTMLRKDGSTFPAEIHSVAIIKDGRTVGLRGFIIDITRRKQAEEELRKSEEKFRLLIENAPDAIYVHADARFVYLNPAAVNLFGAECADQLIGARIMDRYSPDYHEMIAGRLHDLYEKRRTLPIVEQVYLRLDGSSVPVEAHAVPIVYNDQNAALTFARDITDRRQAEAERAKLQGQFIQAQKMESIGRLAGGVAHDFNNMLGVILGHAEMAIGKAEKGQPLVSNLLEIRKAAERSAELTRQLLAFARKQMVSPRLLDLNEVVAGMLKMLKRLIGEEIELAWLPGEALWPVRIDPSQIDQILANLSVNARDAIGGAGRIAIETKNVRLDETYCIDHDGMVPGEYVMLAVGDDGCGMDAETLGKLFEPFFTTKEVGKGTGLGLATVYGIVKQNNGFVDVESKPERGTTFRIYLPRHIGQSEQVRLEAAEQATPRHETVLVVDDEPALLELSKSVLEAQGYRVLTAGTPGEALRLAGEHAGEIHLLLTDVVMPEMDGRNLAKKMLSLHPNLRRLFMSGYTADAIAHRGVLDEGASFIQKPFSIKELAAKVREALGGNGEK